MKMIEVGEKPKTTRIAVARAFVHLSAATLRIATQGEAEKGDVLGAARLAGVMAAKRTPDFVPLCHPIALSGVEVTVEPRSEGLEVLATVTAHDRTGVEMEALSAVCAGALTIYDMLKRYERGMRIEGVELVEKSGGRSGLWRRGDEQDAVRAGAAAEHE
jgi:cyclic pyranopterin phosphate synthase